VPAKKIFYTRLKQGFSMNNLPLHSEDFAASTAFALLQNLVFAYLVIVWHTAVMQLFTC